MCPLTEDFDVEGNLPPLALPETVRHAVLAALSARLQFSSQPVWVEMAWITALVGMVGNPTMRRVAARAIHAMGASPTTGAVSRFVWHWWYQRATGEVLAYQADRLTLEWAEEHVEAPDRLPEGGCILLSVHQFEQLLGFARLSGAVNELGVASLFEPLSESDPNLLRTGRGRGLSDE